MNLPVRGSTTDHVIPYSVLIEPLADRPRIFPVTVVRSFGPGLCDTGAGIVNVKLPLRTFAVAFGAIGTTRISFLTTGYAPRHDTVTLVFSLLTVVVLARNEIFAF